MCSTLFQFCSTSCQMAQPPKRTTNDSAGATCILSPRDFFNLLDHKELHAKKTVLEHNLDHKKLHAKRPIWSTIWSTKSCTRKHPSGARFGAQKVARENTHLEHDLEHKKLHAKRPIWSTIWSTKSCKKHGKKPYPIMQNEFVFCAIFGMLQKKWATCTISSSICQLSIV